MNQDQVAPGNVDLEHVVDEQIQEVPTETLFRDVTAAFRLNGVFNDVVRTPDGRVFRRVLLSALARGVPMFHQLSLFNQNTAPCLPQTRFVYPGLIRVDGALFE